MNSRYNLHPCSGPSSRLGRRTFLAGGLGATLSLTIRDWQTAAYATEQPRKAAKSCILLWMNGGPSHIDTFDPKPGTKNGGPFKAIKTKISGVEICEHLPQVAEVADKLAVIRSMTSKEGDHSRGRYLMHTGYMLSGTLKHPGFGSWVSRELGDRSSEIPRFVCIRGATIGAGFLGVEHNPFAVQDPAEGVRNLPLPKDVDLPRFARRRRGLDFLQKRFQSETGQPGIANLNAIYDQASKLVRSPKSRVFNIHEEPAETHKRYGDSKFGQGCLMARRLVEAGVKFVEVTLDGWDTHVDNFTGVKSLCGELDPALSALITDLDNRDLLDDTLVIWMGEFGRSPTITNNDGRNHHPAAWSALLAGGGVRVGQAYGGTDKDGAKVAGRPVTVPNFFATLATLMGIDPAAEVMSPVGRPIAISDAGTPVKKLIS